MLDILHKHAHILSQNSHIYMKYILSCPYADDNSVVEKENFDDAEKRKEIVRSFSRSFSGN